MKITAIILAGGKGERFWPKSRTLLPKQFLSLTGDGKTMIELTVERINHLVSYEDMYIVTNSTYVDLVISQLPMIPIENIIAEPVAKNTAPGIGLAATIIAKKYGDAKMIILPSDHLIKQELIYLDILNLALKVASEDDNLVTIGITPNYPETGYGYINYRTSDYPNKYANVYKVEKFVEKPNLEKAIEYLKSGNYLWNSGMFVWKVSTILKYYKRFIPETYDVLMAIAETTGKNNFAQTLNELFPKINAISIDYAIMEKAENIYTIPGPFGWDDVGSWLAIERIKERDEFDNTIGGNVVTIDTKNTIILGRKKLIATIGIEDLIIVDTDDVILICDKNESQKVKDMIQKLKDTHQNEYL
jgi:mannose-1-phosphate guanylyltransferase